MFVLALLLAFDVPVPRSPAGNQWYDVAASNRRSIVMSMREACLVLFMLLTPFVTTVLGIVAISQIRHSGGRLYGLPLAMVDALVFPLLALDGVLLQAAIVLFVGLISLAMPAPGILGEHFVGLVLTAAVPTWLVLSVFSNLWIVRRVWRAVSKPAAVRTLAIAPALTGIA